MFTENLVDIDYNIEKTQTYTIQQTKQEMLNQSILFETIIKKDNNSNDLLKKIVWSWFMGILWFCIYPIYQIFIKNKKYDLNEEYDYLQDN